MKYRLATILILSQLVTLGLAQTQQREHWVATWTTAQELARSQPTAATRPPATAGAPPAATPPAATPARPVPAGMRGLDNQTIRIIIRTSIGGRRIRIEHHFEQRAKRVLAKIPLQETK